jgi:hypothetical protein
MTTALATIGHNSPPDPIKEALAPFTDFLAEAENWCDGAKVENDGQEAAVDKLIKEIKAAKKSVEAAEESDAKPIYDLWKARKATWKPTLDDLDRVVKSLVATVDPFKRAKAAAKEEAARVARVAAAQAAEEAKKAHAAATDTSDLEANRKADEMLAAAMIAGYVAKRAEQDNVKGMRTYTIVTVTDGKALATHIWQHDRAAMDAFLQTYADKHHSAPGVTITTEKRAV